MPRRAAGPRLYFHEKNGVWVIRDGSKMRSTGRRESDRTGAERALERYLASKRRAPDSPRETDELMIADVLSIYGQERGAETASPERIAYAIQALLGFWGDRRVSAIKGETCRAYARERNRSDGTVRFELGVLAAALHHCKREGYLIDAPALWRPSPSPPRERWLTLSEAAALVRASRPWPHLTRFVLLGLYTGSRSGVLTGLQWLPNSQGGHVDLEKGLLYRQPAVARQTKKRAPPAPLPRQLWAHLRRWRPMSRQFVVEWRGERVLKVRRSWEAARRAAGLDASVTPHVLRHTAATWMMQRGANIDEAGGLLGMDAATLRRVYGHHHPDFMKSAREALER